MTHLIHRRFFAPSWFALVFISAGAVHATPDNDRKIIERQSQEFSDASASGDAKTIAELLDDDVVFMDESGEIGTKKDIVASAKPSSGDITNQLKQSDFALKFQGGVAVTSFTDNSTVRALGQTYTARYRSIEVWRKKSGVWKMISSQTLALSDDPPAQRLSTATLDQYVGTYRAGDHFIVKISREGDSLNSATNGGEAHPLLAEASDVLFTPGQPRLRRVFERDESGRIIAFRSLREGHGLRFTRDT